MGGRGGGGGDAYDDENGDLMALRMLESVAASRFLTPSSLYVGVCARAAASGDDNGGGGDGVSELVRARAVARFCTPVAASVGGALSWLRAGGAAGVAPPVCIVMLAPQPTLLVALLALCSDSDARQIVALSGAARHLVLVLQGAEQRARFGFDFGPQRVGDDSGAGWGVVLHTRATAENTFGTRGGLGTASTPLAVRTLVSPSACESTRLVLETHTENASNNAFKRREALSVLAMADALFDGDAECMPSASVYGRIEMAAAGSSDAAATNSPQQPAELTAAATPPPGMHMRCAFSALHVDACVARWLNGNRQVNV